MLRAIVMGLSALVAAGVASAQPPRPQQDPGPAKVAGVEYQKRGTREETERRMIALLRPDEARWGEWYLATPFPWARKARDGPGLRDAGPVEAELPKMKAGGGGAGPDLKAEYEGKKGTKVSWRPLGDRVNRGIDMRVMGDNELDEFACAYLYTTAEVDRATTLEVTMGSDDGLRFWLNGKLLVDADVERGMDAEAHKVKLDLQPGVNHILAKISNGVGGFEYQMNTRAPLDPRTDAQLQYFLNRDFPPTPEEKYYRALTIPLPPEVVLEVGGLDVLPPDPKGECRPIVCTRRGDVYIVEGAYEDPPFAARFKKFASGLHEPLGLAVRLEPGPEGAKRTVVYCVQRGELTKLIDTDGDDAADVYETFCDGWGVSGNYHEFAFGPKFDREGNAWVTLNVGFCGGLGKAIAPYRGWAVKIAPDGRMTPHSDGLRSPNGIGMFGGTVFYMDNQGDYVGTNRMTELVAGSFAGHPASLRWRTDWTPGDPNPPIQPATLWLPYKKMGQSGADFLVQAPESQIEQVSAAVGAGKFGPFAGQVFIGDQTLSFVSRTCLEKVEGHWQGACFPFRGGLDCGVNRICWGGDGSMFVGQTDRGWSSVGRMRYGLQRIVWTGEVPFEVHTMRITADGFELRFTEDLDKASAGDPASYGMLSYTYEYHPEYGSKEMESAPQTIAAARVVDARTVRLTIDKLRSGGMGWVHELSLPGVKSARGEGLLHPIGYYTVQRVPAGAAAQR